MRFALIFNPFSYKLHEENLRIVQKYFGLFPPLSLAWVAAIAEKAGHKCIIIDARTEDLTKEETLDRLKQFKPDIMGFMMTTYMYRETLEWIKFLKRSLKIPVVIGGYNLRVYPKESVMPDEIDFGCLLHAYHTIPKLLHELETTRDFDTVPGLIYKKDGEIIVNEDLPINFDEFPNPARHLLPNELYAEFPTQRRNFTVMVTSLGCPKRCIFCEAGGTLYSPRTPQTVVNEIEECYKKYNIREIDIFEYDFTAIRKRVLEICKGIQERNLDISWACRSRIDWVDDELLREMKKAGCSRIYYGIESGSQEILDRLNKGITLDQIRETIKLTKYYNIQALGFFLIGSPGETKETINQTIKFAKELKLDYVQFSKLTAKPLTGMWREMINSGWQDYWKEYILGRTNEEALPRPWCNFTNQEIDKLTKYAYLKFHLRGKFLLTHTLRVKSLKEFKRKFFALIDMAFSQEDVAEKWLKKNKEFKAFNENISIFRKILQWIKLKLLLL